MGLLNLIGNKLITSNAVNPAGGKRGSVVTLTTNYNGMPKDGERLISVGYKLQTMSCDRYGHYTWVFVLSETAPQATTAQSNAPTTVYNEYAPTDGVFSPQDPIVRKAITISIQKGKYSSAMLQVYLGRTHDYIESLTLWLEENGIIGPKNGNKPRDLLISSIAEFDKKTSNPTK